MFKRGSVSQSDVAHRHLLPRSKQFARQEETKHLASDVREQPATPAEAEERECQRNDYGRDKDAEEHWQEEDA
jgi:hypothetical protein